MIPAYALAVTATVLAASGGATSERRIVSNDPVSDMPRYPMLGNPSKGFSNVFGHRGANQRQRRKRARQTRWG